MLKYLSFYCVKNVKIEFQISAEHHVQRLSRSNEMRSLSNPKWFPPPPDLFSHPILYSNGVTNLGSDQTFLLNNLAVSSILIYSSQAGSFKENLYMTTMPCLSISLFTFCMRKLWNSPNIRPN